MPSPAQIATQFADVKALLDQCLEHSGGTYEAPSPGAAVHFRQRVYTFRKAYREAISPAASPYDRLTVRKLTKGTTKVEIGVITLSGTFTPASGEAVRIEPVTEILEDDPLLQEAIRLRQTLDLD